MLPAKADGLKKLWEKWNAIRGTHMTCNDREGINTELQPPPLPSSTKPPADLAAFSSSCCSHCGFAHLLQSFRSIAFSSALKSNTCSRLCVGEGKIPSLTSFFLRFSNLSPEGSPNLSSGSISFSPAKLLPWQQGQGFVTPCSSSLYKSNLQTLQWFPYAVLLFSLPFNHWHNCHNVCFSACFSTSCTVLVPPAWTKPHWLWHLCDICVTRGQSWWLGRKLSHVLPK